MEALEVAPRAGLTLPPSPPRGSSGLHHGSLRSSTQVSNKRLEEGQIIHIPFAVTN